MRIIVSSKGKNVRYLAIFMSVVVASPACAIEELSRQDRIAVFESVDQICRLPNPIGNIITYKGSLQTNAALKIKGIAAEPKITKQQWDFFEQKYHEFKSDHENCKRELVKALHPFFGIISCRNAMYGVEKFQRELFLEKNSEWIEGNGDLDFWCNEFVVDLYRKHGNADFEVIEKSQQNKTNCDGSRCNLHKFSCRVHAQLDPLYREKPGGC